jgi:hypothetical protein
MLHDLQTRMTWRMLYSHLHRNDGVMLNIGCWLSLWLENSMLFLHKNKKQRSALFLFKQLLLCQNVFTKWNTRL